MRFSTLHHGAFLTVVVVGLAAGGWAQSSSSSASSNSGGSNSSGLQSSEFSVQVSGVFTGSTTFNNVTTSPSSHIADNSAGLLVGYRLHVNHWEAVEIEYGYTHNGQQYIVPSNVTGAPATNYAVSTAMHQLILNEVFETPRLFGVLQPFILGGGGLVRFDPNSSSSAAGFVAQNKGAFNYGAGIDFHVFNLGARIEFQELMFKLPDFGNPLLYTDKWAHVAQPSVGLIFTF